MNFVRSTVTASAIGREKTRRSQNLIFEGELYWKVRCSPIFSFCVIRSLYAITRIIFTVRDLVKLESVTASAIGSANSRRFQRKMIERCVYPKVRCNSIFFSSNFAFLWLFESENQLRFTSIVQSRKQLITVLWMNNQRVFSSDSLTSRPLDSKCSDHQTLKISTVNSLWARRTINLKFVLEIADSGQVLNGNPRKLA